MKNTTLKNKQDAIVLEELKLSASEPNRLSSAIFYLLFLILGAGSSLCCLYSSFSIPISVVTIVFFFIVFSVCFTAIYLMKRRNIGFVIGAAAIGAIFFILFKDSIYRGFLIAMKYILEQFREKGSGVIFPSGWNDLIKGADYTLDSTIFLLLLMYIFIFLEAWSIIQRRNFFLAAFVTLPFILTPILVPLTPSYTAIVLLFLFYGMAMFLSPAIGGNRIFRRGLRGYHISSPSAAHPIAFTALPILLVIMLVISLIFPQSAFHRSEFLDAVRLSFIKGFDSTEISRYLNSKFGGDISSISFSDIGNISFKDLPALRLTLTDGAGLREEKIGHKEYIKSYVGSVYSEDGWDVLSENKSVEVKNILGENSTQQIFHNVQQIFGVSSSVNAFSVLAEWCQTGNPRQLYIPYNLIDIQPKEELLYVDDAYITAIDENRGLDTYAYSAYSSKNNPSSSLYDMVQNMYIQNFMDIDDYINNYFEPVEIDREVLSIDENGYIVFTDKYGNVYETGQKVNLDEYYGSQSNDKKIRNSDADINTLISELYDYGVLSKEQVNYLNMLISYNKFVTENYTQLPDSTKSFLQNFIKEKNISTESMEETISDVVNLLVYSGEYEYTLSPGKAPSDTDFAEYFLTQNKKGYCRHFATSAVLLLRAAGVPARYAEGFSFDTSELTSKSSIELLDSDAHAWVEVYYSGTGWTALEVTSSSSYVGNESSLESSDEVSNESSAESSIGGIESSIVTSGESSEVSSSPDASSQQTSQAVQDNISNSNSVITYILFIPMCMIIVFATLWINRFVRIKKRKSKFNNKNKNKAVLEVYTYIVQLLFYRTKPNENISDYDNIKNLIGREDISQEKKRLYRVFCDEIYPIAEKAKFSNKAISLEECEFMLKYLQKARNMTMSNLNFFQRLVAKYLDII